MDQEIEVGEVKEDGLRLWCARLALEYAKEESKRFDDGIQRLKNRANSLIGWAVPISIALCAVLFTHKEFQVSSFLMLMGMLVVAFFCVRTLYPTPLKFVYIKADGVKQIFDNFDTELEIIESITLRYEEYNNKCCSIYIKKQKEMNIAWIFFIITPIIGSINQFYITYFL